jgi:hypothetical protein
MFSNIITKKLVNFQIQQEELFSLRLCKQVFFPDGYLVYGHYFLSSEAYAYTLRRTT